MSPKNISVKLLAVLFLMTLVLAACSSKSSIVGQWQFETTNGRWDYAWMEFFEDGTYADSNGNSRTYTLLSDGRLKLTSNLDGFTQLFDIKINGDSMTIADENGNAATGTRQVR
jgi:hypothetical protein